MITIMGKATRSVKNLNAWLASKKCPQYADLYRQAGEEFGVRWDMAIFQSCLETGWFWNNSGPFDVKKEQHNFAGLGATGGGVPGDSFPDALTGIRAQLQDLALRCDTFLPKESIISPYAKKQYETISNRHSKHWEDLSGTWAADKNYHTKIYSIMNDFDSKYPNEEKPMEKITWFETNRSDAGKPFITAYAEEKAVYTHPITTVYELYTWACKLGSEGANLEVAETDKKAIPKVPDWGAEPKPDKEWIPFAKTIPLFKTRKYHDGWPRGLVVHFTAGGDDAVGTANYLRDKGYPCLVLAKNGDVLQGFPVTEGGAHSGTDHHNYCVGVEIVCAGKLTPMNDGGGKSWFDKVIPEDKCRDFQAPPAKAPQVSGRYEAYTEVQEQKLIKLCLWYKEMEPKIFSFDNVLGHDECTQLAGQGSRKNDPGGSLSMPMPEFRGLLKKLWDEGKRFGDY